MASGITVSTLAEAHFFQRAGFDDITYAFPITPNKLDEAADLTRRLKHFHLLVDQFATAGAVSAYGRDNHVSFSVFLKVDCGYHRAGVDPTSPDSVRLVETMQSSPHMRFKGILTHAGHSYHCRDREEITAVARQERKVMAEFAERLKKSRIVCESVSVGSTPTAVSRSTDPVCQIDPDRRPEWHWPYRAWAGPARRYRYLSGNQHRLV